MEKFVIEGGVPLSGTVTPAGNKNGALPILAAALLTDEEVVLRNVPRIRDVEAMLELLARPRRHASSGATTNEVAAATRRRRPRRDVDRELAERIRASFLLAGPLLARFGRAEMPPPGGDVIGRRRLDPHLDAFRALGADRRARPRHRRSTRPTAACAPCDFFMDEPSVMAHRERADGRRADAAARRSSATPPASRTSRTSRGCSSRWAPTIDGHRLQRA